MSINQSSLSVLICRGCCCGTQQGVDHDGHLGVITAAAVDAGGRVKVTKCIGPCDRKNVVVVRTRAPQSRWVARYYQAVEGAEVESLRTWFASGVLDHPEPMELSNVRFDWPLPRLQNAEPADGRS